MSIYPIKQDTNLNKMDRYPNYSDIFTEISDTYTDNIDNSPKNLNIYPEEKDTSTNILNTHPDPMEKIFIDISGRKNDFADVFCKNYL